MSPTKIIDVLLVEDDPGDVLMTREAFEDNKVANRLAVVSDGVSALAYLRKGTPDRAVTHAQKARALSGTRPDVIALGGYTVARAGRRWDQTMATTARATSQIDTARCMRVRGWLRDEAIPAAMYTRPNRRASDLNTA